MLKSAAHNYNQNVVGEAKTEGTNRVADLIKQLQANMASVTAAAAKASGKGSGKGGKSGGSSSGNLNLKNGVLDFLGQLGGSGASGLGNAFEQYLSSAQGQMGGSEFQTGVNPDTGKAIMGFRPSTAGSIGNALVQNVQAGNDQAAQSSRNIQIAKALAPIIGKTAQKYGN